MELFGYLNGISDGLSQGNVRRKMGIALAAVVVMFVAGAFVGLSSDDGSDALGIGFEVDGIGYQVIATDEVKITSSYGVDIASLTIPLTVTHESNTYNVTTIADGAFRDKNIMTFVEIPSSVTTIEGFAFYDCTKLTTITIPASVTSIGTRAFHGCERLSSIQVSEDSNNFSSCGGILYNKNQTELIRCPISWRDSYPVSSSVTSIGAYAFDECVNLTSIYIPASVTSVGPYAFFKCNGLTKISVDEASPYFCSVGDVLFDKGMTKLIKYPTNKYAGEYVIPNGVTTVAIGAFEDSMLYSVSLPETLTTIEYAAFNNSIKLMSLVIPNSVTIIEDQAFGNCYSLRSVTIGTGVTEIGDSAFFVLNFYDANRSSLNQSAYDLGGKKFEHGGSGYKLYQVQGVVKFGEDVIVKAGGSLVSSGQFIDPGTVLTVTPVDRAGYDVGVVTASDGGGHGEYLHDGAIRRIIQCNL